MRWETCRQAFKREWFMHWNCGFLFTIRWITILNLSLFWVNHCNQCMEWVGPSALASSSPTHEIINGVLFKLPASSSDLYTASSASSQLAGSNYGRFSPTRSRKSAPIPGKVNASVPSSASSQLDEPQDIEIYDRLPSAAHFNKLDIPSKIEWFACPEGAVNILSMQRSVVIDFNTLSVTYVNWFIDQNLTSDHSYWILAGRMKRFVDSLWTSWWRQQ